MKLTIFCLLLLFTHSVLLEGCRKVEIEWQCETKGGGMVEPVTKNCSSSLDKALTAIEEAVCQGRLSVNLTLLSQYESLNRNVAFSAKNISQIQVKSHNRAVINCTERNASFTFGGEAVTNYHLMIQITNIIFQHCGPGSHLSIPTALFFSNNCTIKLNYVRIEKSHGVGLCIVDVTGNVSITNSKFYQNKFVNGYGGGVHLTIANNSENATIVFSKCSFEENKASPPHQHHKQDTQGGGLYVQYRNHSKYGIVYIEHCQFINNEAEWGSGILALLNNSAWKNKLVINSSEFRNNSANRNNYTARMAGGGIGITIYSNAASNDIIIENCNFIGNVAPWGGGLIVYSQPLQSQNNERNLLNISRCRFIGNIGRIGAAIHIYCISPPSTPQQCNAEPVIKNCTVSNNRNLPSHLVPPELTQSQHSIVHTSRFPTVLSQRIEFLNNSGTPLYVHESSVTVDNDTLLNFTNNTAENGGAISLYGSWITVSNNSQLVFINNTVTGFGGAIYVYMTEEVYLPYSHHCFIKSIEDRDPQNWTSRFLFDRNRYYNNTPNAIYATSILPCVWERDNLSLDERIRETFCGWTGWKFVHGSCSDLITTSPRNFSSTLKNMTLYPGIPGEHLIYAVDDLGHNVNSFFVYPALLSPKNGVLAHVNNRTLTVFGTIGTETKVQLQLNSIRRLEMTMNVSLKECPPGFSFSSETCSCICKNNQYIQCGYNESRKIANVIAGYCMSYSPIPNDPKHKYIVSGQCLFTSGLYNESDGKYTPTLVLPLPYDKEQLQQKVCRNLNRTGILCGECMENYSIDILSISFQCRHCSGSLKNWLIYLTAEGLPPLIFFSVVLILHISLTSGPLNGFIFFSQVITVSIEIILLQTSWMHTPIKSSNFLTGFIIRAYSIWSLDFLRFAHGYYYLCLGSNLKVMHVLVLRYLSVIYPLCFLIVAFIVIELHAHNCRLLVWLWKPLCFLCARFRQVWKARTSIVDAFAAFILLSYVKLVRISILLVTYTKISVHNNSHTITTMNYDPTVIYMSREHIPFWLIAGVLLLTFGLVPPFLLTFYQFKFSQKLLNKYRLNGSGLRIFMDAFQGCYKDGRDGGPDRRYYAGFYFIFRLVVFSIFDITVSISTAYMQLIVAFIAFGVITAVLRPYKANFFTYLDVIFFNILAIIITLQFFAIYKAIESVGLPISTVGLTFTLIMIPFIYTCLYILWWIGGRAPIKIKRKVFHLLWYIRGVFTRNSQVYAINSYSTFDNVPNSLPDRLEHSFRYKSAKD